MAHNEQVQRALFGGFNKSAAFFGWLVATAVTALLTALIGAAGGAVALTNGLEGVAKNAPTVGWVGAALLLLALAVAYYAGGYVAGRMSRFDGGRQGVGVWVMGIVMTLLLALAGWLLGSQYNLLQQLNLPRIPIGQGSLTVAGLVTLLLALAATLAAAVAGAKAGEGYHRAIDRAGNAVSALMDRDQRPADRRRTYAADERRAADDRRAVRDRYAAQRAQPSFGERIETYFRRK
jgi:hypothetical protein